MLFLITAKTDKPILKKAAEDLGGYIKCVVDIKRQVLAIGGTRHVEGEQLLLENGSKQQNLWGGGIDLETNELDFDSMINIRPPDNASREVLSGKIRQKMESIIKKLFP